MRTATLATLVAISAMTLFGCKKPEQTREQKEAAAKAEAAVGTRQDVYKALDDSSDLSVMAKLVKSAGLEKTLGGVGSYTLFAPTDAAFARLPQDQRQLLESKDGRPQLLALLRQHIVTGYIAQADLEKGLARSGGAASLATMGGAPIRIHKGQNGMLVGQGETGPHVTSEPILSRNGVIYRIDQIIPPPTK